jgi:hypothetical protein
MKRKLATTTALCLLIVALIALAAVPTASAKATRIPITLSEMFVSSTPVEGAYRVTGGVAHLEFNNVFYDTSPTHDPMQEGYTYTHLYAVATLVDGVPTDSVIRGTARRETLDGSVWEGTFSGSMNMQTLTWNCLVRGMGVSGPCTGWIMWAWNVKTEPGFAAAAIDGWALAPHGF